VQLVSKISNLCGADPPTSRTDGWTDRRTTCNRKTALGTKVHRAVKTRYCVISILTPFIVIASSRTVNKNVNSTGAV